MFVGVECVGVCAFGCGDESGCLLTLLYKAKCHDQYRNVT